jgi:ATP-dependent DNA ligase
VALVEEDQVNVGVFLRFKLDDLGLDPPHASLIAGRACRRRRVGEPYSERRRILSTLKLDGPRWRTPEAFDDGEALWEAVCEHELEGVVAKRRSGRYIPAERAWIKTKNRAYWRYELEREGAFKSRAKQFV